MGLVGRLDDLALPEIFSLLSLSRKTGKLVLRHKEETACVIFSGGQVVQAATSSLRESLGHLLLLQKVIKENELMAALEIQRGSTRKKRLGGILVEKGFVSQEVLENTIKRQIEEIIFEILNWKEGVFNFELGETNVGDEIGVDTHEFLLRSGIKAEYLIMEGARLFDEKRKIISETLSIPLTSTQEIDALKDSLKEIALETSALSTMEPLDLADLGLKEESFPPLSGEKSSVKEGPALPELTALRSMFMELRLRSLNGEITLLIMRYASETIDRGILLMVKGNHVCGLGQFGIDLSEVTADQQVRSIRIPLNELSIFSWSLEWAQSYKGPIPKGKGNDYLINILGGGYPQEVLVIPMVVEKKVVALVYGDNLPSGRPIANVDTLEIFVNQAGLAMEKALLEHRLQELQKK